MARARNIKPGFFMNEDLTELLFEYRLLFIGLWTLADREGKLEDRPKRIKMELFPADNVDVDQGLSELERYGFVERYEVNGVRVVMILKFTEHQRPHHTEKASELPNKDGSLPVAEPKKERPSTDDGSTDNGELTVKGALSDGGNPPDSLNPDSLIPDSLNPDSGSQREVDPEPQTARTSSPPASQSSRSPKATRLSEEWAIPDDWLAWALQERADWVPAYAHSVADQFRDYWCAKGGADARKVDWFATWRNWVRREKSGVPAHVTASRPSFSHQRAQAAIDEFVHGPSSRDDNVIDVEVRHVGF